MTMGCKVGAASVLLCAGLAWLAVGATLGQEKAKKEQGKADPEILYFGVSACTRCHTGMPKVHAQLFMKLKLQSLCKCDEQPVWEQKDKHGLAYKALLTPRGEAMAKALKCDVTKSKECLACHGVVIENPKEMDALFDIADGVSCVVCHGPDPRWVRFHGSDIGADRTKWRELTRETKEQDWGMTDLWNPAKRAALCASCHIGAFPDNTRKQRHPYKTRKERHKKFVTHEMYAAGHPPLPSFEAATFSREMPRHWELFCEKGDRVSADFVKKEFNVDVTEPEETKMLLVGAVVSFAQYMRLLADDAKSSLAKDAGDRGLDLAHYDCYACHHDLKSPNWRQKRDGAAGKPGRVPMRPWPTALLEIALRQLADQADAERRSAELAKGLKSLRGAFEVRPYGDPAQIHDYASQLADWGDQLARDMTLDKNTLTKAKAREILTALPKVYQVRLLDYDSARQVAWALKVMHEELRPSPGDKEVQETLASLKTTLKLDLPAGRKRWIVDELKERMDVLYSFEPDPFKQALRKLARPPGNK